MSKFDSMRDEVLYSLCIEGWANAETGSDDFGQVTWKISNEAADVAAINGEFQSLLNALELEVTPEDRAELVGHFLVHQAADGGVTVVRWGRVAERDRFFDHLEATYATYLKAVEADA